jgi:ribose 1,5-bisphosphokinase PhnN
MRHRALIHVVGPSGDRKTALVEALLRGLSEFMICVRARRAIRSVS